MAKTAIADIIVPNVWAPYMLERTTTLSELIKAGIARRDPDFDARANVGGQNVDMPFWKEFTGNSEVLSDGGNMTVNKITAGRDTAALHNRGYTLGVNDLAKWISGSDPASEIAEGLAEFWNRDMQSMVFSILKGLFDNTNGILRTTHRLNIYSDVIAKNAAAVKWCRQAADRAKTCPGKPWIHPLIPQNVMAENVTPQWLARQFSDQRSRASIS